MQLGLSVHEVESGSSDDEDANAVEKDKGGKQPKGAAYGDMFQDDDNSNDKDKEPRHVFTQRRKRKRITSCNV